ncbi:unnamed protein product [Caenorhabditis nigoni]
MNANCSAMLSLASSSPLKLSIVYNLIIACIGFPLFFWASIRLWSGTFTKIFHKNFRLIIQMHLLGFLIHCFGRVMLHSLDLYNYHFRDPCDMIPDIYRCFVFRLMYNSGMWITTCTAVSLIIERMIATYLRGQYENQYIWIGILLMFLTPAIASFPLYLAYSNLKFDGVFMPYCSVYKPGHPEIANLNSGVAIGAQIVARIMFGYLFHLNKKLREKMQRSSLSTRFQLEQNKNSTQCLKIYANISTIFLILQIGSFTYLLKVAPGIPKEHYLALMELNCQFPLYGIITILLVTKRISSVRNHISSTLTSQLNLDRKEAYFANFNQQIGAVKPLTKKY